MATLLLLAATGGMTSVLVDTFDSSDRTQSIGIYAIEDDVPQNIGAFTNVSEDVITAEFRSLGDKKGRLGEYKNGSELVTVVMFTFPNPDEAHIAFEEMEESLIDTDFCFSGPDKFGYTSCRVVGNTVYLVWGSEDAVYEVIYGL